MKMRRAGAVDHARQEVAAEIVGAEPDAAADIGSQTSPTISPMP